MPLGTAASRRAASAWERGPGTAVFRRIEADMMKFLAGSRRRAEPITRAARTGRGRRTCAGSPCTGALCGIGSAHHMTDGHSADRRRGGTPGARARPRPDRPGPLHRLRHPDDRHPGLLGGDGLRLVLLVGHHDDGLLHPLRPDHGRAGLGLAGGGRRLRLGSRGLRAEVGLDGRLDVLDQQRDLDPVGLPDLRRDVRPDLPEDPLDLAGGRDRDRPDLADGPRGHRPARGLQVAAQPRRGRQGPHLPRPRRPGALGALPRAAAGQRLLAVEPRPEVERQPRVPSGPPLLDVRLRAHELRRRRDAQPEARRAERDPLVGGADRDPLLLRHRRDPLRGADRKALDRDGDLGRARRPREGVGPRGRHWRSSASVSVSCTRASPTS